MTLARPNQPRVSGSDAPPEGLKRWMVRLTEFDVWDIRIDAPDPRTAERFARDYFCAGGWARDDFEHAYGDVEHVEAEEDHSLTPSPATRVVAREDTGRPDPTDSDATNGGGA